MPSQITFVEVDNGNGNVVPQVEVVVLEENGLAVEKGLAKENGHAKENSLVENSVASSQNVPPSATKDNIILNYH